MTHKLVYTFENKDLSTVLDQLGDKIRQPGFIPKLVGLTPKLVKTDPQVGQNRSPSWLKFYRITTYVDSGESASNTSITSGVRRCASSLAASTLIVVMNH
jgi:hypothetical protein